MAQRPPRRGRAARTAWPLSVRRIQGWQTAESAQRLKPGVQQLEEQNRPRQKRQRPAIDRRRRRQSRRRQLQAHPAVLGRALDEHAAPQGTHRRLFPLEGVDRCRQPRLPDAPPRRSSQHVADPLLARQRDQYPHHGQAAEKRMASRHHHLRRLYPRRRIGDLRRWQTRRDGDSQGQPLQEHYRRRERPHRYRPTVPRRWLCQGSRR